MALLKCKDCGNGVSSSAKACPNCGAPASKGTQWGIGKKFLAGIFILIVVSGVIDAIKSEDKPGSAVAASNPTTPQAAAAPLSPAARGAAVAVTIKRAARNPDVFKLEEARHARDGSICLVFRAQNGFGGMNREEAVSVGDTITLQNDQGFSGVWNKHCVKPADVITEDVERIAAAMN